MSKGYKASQASESVVIYVGTPPKTVELIRDLVLSIIDSNAGDAVKIGAIQSVCAGLQVNGTTIHDCTFTVGKS
jgi:hypothetical protein